MTARVSEVAARVGGEVLGGDAAGDVALITVGHDSRSVQADSLFCCVRGDHFDGHRFAADAVEAGAAALLVDHPVDADVPLIVVPDVRRAMGPASALVHGDPSHELTVVGVTGTNGKTTSVHLFAAVLGRDGSRVDTLGTLTGPRTTPEAPELQAWLAEGVARRLRYVAMEVSSHALDMFRVEGTHFRVAVFTNLGHDHLDHHQDVESYYRAKARLFDAGCCDIAVVNTDDPAGQRLAGEIEAAGGVDLHRFGLADAGDVTIRGSGTSFFWNGLPIELHLAGLHNVRNALGVAVAAEALGLDPVDIADALCAVEPPRGRFEFVDVGQAATVAVDYAHTPDALAAALDAAGRIARSGTATGVGRTILVFGCGGDRDAGKRPLMGATAVAGADLVFVTSDNPRSEDPEAIIAAVLGGIEGGDRHPAVMVEPDRARAIALALDASGPGDVVLIAGKGHETTQVIGDRVLEFDDRAVAIDHLMAQGGASR